MTDQPVREIQLGGKQLVFLFMAAVVLAVAVFLLGISVGRGVRGASDQPAATTDVAVAETAAPADMPPKTVTSPADLRYHDQLQGEPAAAAASEPAPAKPIEPPAPVADQPASAEVMNDAAAARDAKAAAPVAAPKVDAKKPASDKTAARGAEAPKPEPPAKAAPVAAGTGWFVQVDSFRSKENADRQTATLKGKGYAAMISPAAGLYRVRVGPFADRADAEKVRQKLQREEGLKPSIQR
jgi:DedD protein